MEMTNLYHAVDEGVDLASKGKTNEGLPNFSFR
jgi:hypothetical protein